MPTDLVSRAGRTARELCWPDLIWSHFSRARYDDFDARIEAAAAAGYAGIGLYNQAWAKMRDAGRTMASIRDALARHQMVLAEIETAVGWWDTSADGEAARLCRHLEQASYELADGLGARYLQAIGPYECPLDQAIEGFAGLCDRAAEHGLLVGIEWLPFTNIYDAADAQAIVEGAGRPNGGYCADIWHHERGAADLEMIRAIGGERIFAVQMNDGPAAPVLDDYKADCLATRVPPGDGAFDCLGFVGLLAEMGVTAPISVEVASTALWAAPVGEAAQAGADGMRRVLAAAGR